MTPTPNNRLWSAFAIVCLFFAWYYGLLVAPIGYAAAGRSILQDLYPVWNGSRQVLLHRGSPYSAAVTAQNQSVMYGAALTGPDEQQCAYPAFVAFPLAPLALLPFKQAQFAAFLAFLFLTPISAIWWSGSYSNALLKVLLVLGAYPVIVALQLRQPTLLFFPLITAAVAWARTRPAIAGVMLAIATAKPQLAIAACVPLLFWAIAGWRERRAFVCSFAITEVALFAAATILVPHWFSQWLNVLSAYRHYNVGRPLVLLFFGSTVGPIISAIIVLSAGFVCWRWREDPVFSIGFSIAALQMIMPFQIYNDIMLLAPIFWIVSHGTTVRALGSIHRILIAAVWMTLAEGVLVVTILGVIGTFAPLVAARFWNFPVTFAFLLPAVVFTAMMAYAASAAWRNSPICREPAFQQQS